eukprot:11036885-Alexandrium_andersonii.AAC.1
MERCNLGRGSTAAFSAVTTYLLRLSCSSLRSQILCGHSDARCGALQGGNGLRSTPPSPFSIPGGE